MRLADGELVGTTDTVDAQRRAKRTQTNLRKGLKKYASTNADTRRRFKVIVDKLVKSESRVTTGLETATGPRQRQETPREQLYDPPEGVVQCLYKALCYHSRLCTCSLHAELKSSNGHHAARLSVSHEAVVSNKGLTQFDISFSRMPQSLEGEMNSHWQHLRLSVPNLAVLNGPQNNMRRGATQRVSRNVEDTSEASVAVCASNSKAKATPAPVIANQLINPETGASTKSQATPPTRDETIKDFCDLLQRDLDEVRLCFRVENDALIDLDDAEILEPRVGPTASISLADVLEGKRLSTKTRLTLAYSVARSIWLYYNSDWMMKPWTSDSIHFMPHGGSNFDESSVLSIANTSNPCLALQFDGSELQFGNFPETHEAQHTVHKYPRVRALGNLLLELGRSHSAKRAAIPDPPNPSVRDGVAKAINHECAQAVYTIKYDRTWPDFDIRDQHQVDIYKEAVRSCFEILKMLKEWALFDTSRKGRGKRDKEVTDLRPINELPLDDQIKLRREFLYQKVVAPLEKLLKNAEIIESTVSLGLVNTASSPSSGIEKTFVKQGLNPSQCVDIISSTMTQ